MPTMYIGVIQGTCGDSKVASVFKAGCSCTNVCKSLKVLVAIFCSSTKGESTPTTKVHTQMKSTPGSIVNRDSAAGNKNEILKDSRQ
jgi:hypothetical protein